MPSAAESEGGVRRGYEDHNLLVLWGVTLMAVPGVSSVTPAFPRSENEFRGAFMATNGMTPRTGQTVGPLLMASLADALGAASIALVAFLLALVLVRQLSDDTTLPVAAAPHSRFTARYLPNERLNQSAKSVTGMCLALLSGDARVPGT